MPIPLNQPMTGDSLTLHEPTFMKTTLPEIIKQVPLHVLQTEIARRDASTIKPALQQQFLELCHTVAEHYSVDPQAMRTKNRKEIYTWPRYVLMHILRKLDWQLQTIADAFDYKDHTSIIHGLRCFAIRTRTDHAMYDFAEKMIRENSVPQPAPDCDSVIYKISKHLQLS